ncbi:MAG: O-antigen ligase family protein [Deltaproteobacteria bacterium]
MDAPATTPALEGRRGRSLTVGLSLVFLVGVVWASLSGAGVFVLIVAFAALAGVLVLRNPVIGILIYLVTFLFTYPEALKGSGNFTINNMLGLMFLPLMLVGMLREGKVWMLRIRALVLIAAIGVISIASATFYNPGDVTGGVTIEKVHKLRAQSGPTMIEMRDQRTKYMTRYAFLLFFVFFVRRPQDIRWVVAIIISCLLLTYLQVSVQEGPFGWGTGRLRVMGETGTGLYAGRNPNKLAYFALFCLTLLWYMRRAIKWRIFYPFWLLAVAIPVIIIPLTASRSGLINLALFFVIILFEGRFGYRKILGMAVLMLMFTVQVGYQTSILGVLLPEQVASRLTDFNVKTEALVEGQMAGGSAGRRLHNIVVSLTMAAKHPVLGVGLGNFTVERAFTDPTGMTAPPHNSYLMTLVEGGIISLVFQLVLFSGLFRALRRLESDYEARFGGVGLGWLVAAMRTTLIGFLVFSFFADMFVHIFYHIVIGMCIVLIQMHKVYAETGQLPNAAMSPQPTA